MTRPSQVSALLSSLLFVAPLAAQSAWTKAPPPPTAELFIQRDREPRPTP